MHRLTKEAMAWVRERWPMVAIVALITATIIAAIPAVLRLPHYPAEQVAALRGRVATAQLDPQQRLALERDLLQYETDNRVKIWSAIVQAVGGAALLIGLLFTWRNLRATQVKLDIDRQGQLTNRFTQATSQLGAQLSNGKPNVEARLGGIYALAAIARDSPDDHWPIMEILTAYIRHNANGSLLSTEGSAEKTAAEPKPRTDVQAVLTVLGRSTPPISKSHRLVQKLDLRFTDLRGAEFWDAHLEHTDFWGAHMEGAKLWGASLQGAKLVKTHLQGANLRAVRFDGADLTGATGLTRTQIRAALNAGKGAVLPLALDADAARTPIGTA